MQHKFFHRPLLLVGFASLILLPGAAFSYSIPQPEAGALLFFGTSLVGLVGYRRVRRMQ